MAALPIDDDSGPSSISAERPLAAEDEALLARQCAEALRLLRLEGKQRPPRAVVEVIDRYVDDAQRGTVSLWARLRGRAAAPDAGALGALWGEQLVREFGWQWVRVQRRERDVLIVSAPDRSLVLDPARFLQACFADPGKDCTAMLAFNLLAHGKVPPQRPFGYSDLMAGVHRLIPKR